MKKVPFVPDTFFLLAKACPRAATCRPPMATPQRTPPARKSATTARIESARDSPRYEAASSFAFNIVGFPK